MEYKNIEVQVDSLSESQKLDLELAEKLLGFMNSLVTNPSTLSYNGSNFSLVKFGHASFWILKDINFAIKRDVKLTIDFLSNKFNEELTSYNNRVPSDNKEPSFQIFKNRFFSYYKSYPKHIFSEEGNAELTLTISALESLYL